MMQPKSESSPFKIRFSRDGVSVEGHGIVRIGPLEFDVAGETLAPISPREALTRERDALLERLKAIDAELKGIP